MPERNWPTSTSVVAIVGPTGRRESYVEVLATVPPEIAQLDFAIPHAIAKAASEAEAEMVALDVTLNGRSPAILAGIEGYLLRAESISSSRIEGLEISAKNLAEATFEPSAGRWRAREVAANVAAMRAAMALGVEREPLRVDDIADLHAILTRDVPGINEGEFRHSQNWIGTSNDPTEAAYVPPPASEVRRLLDDLVSFANRTDMSVAVQAAIAHAQFEAIHPFIDGNGRVGRCLIGAIVRKRIGVRAFPPISTQLWRHRSGYIADLNHFMVEADPWPWVRRFSHASTAACDSTHSTITKISALQEQWRTRIGKQRQGSAILRLIDELPARTILNTASTAHLLDITDDAARAVLGRLEAAGITHQVSLGRRNRVWRVPEMHDLLDNA